jgi:hypothetical protein
MFVGWRFTHSAAPTLALAGAREELCPVIESITPQAFDETSTAC